MTSPSINADVMEMISFNLPQQKQKLVAERDVLLKKLAETQRDISTVELHILLEEAQRGLAKQTTGELVRSDEAGMQVSNAGESIRSGK